MKFRRWALGMTATLLGLGMPLAAGCGSLGEFLNFDDDCELVIDDECIDDLFTDDDDEDFFDGLDDVFDDDD